MQKRKQYDDAHLKILSQFLFKEPNPAPVKYILSEMGYIQNILRRYKKQDQIFQYQNLQVYISQAKVFKNHQEIFLSALEYKLLLIFVQHAHHLLTREFLLEELYQMTGEDMNDNTLTVYIKRLRNKIEDQPQHPQIIQTKRGLGYQLGD